MARIFHWGTGAYLRNRNQENNVGMLGHASAKDTRLWGGSGDMVPRKNFEIWNPQIARNALKLSILPTQRYFIYIILNLLRSHQAELLVPEGGVSAPRARFSPPPLSYGPGYAAVVITRGDNNSGCSFWKQNNLECVCIQDCLYLCLGCFCLLQEYLEIVWWYEIYVAFRWVAP